MILKPTDRLKQEVALYQQLIRGMLKDSKMMAAKMQAHDQGQRRYITRLQVRLQNRAKDQGTPEWSARVGVEAAACMLDGAGYPGLAKMARGLKKTFVPVEVPRRSDQATSAAG